MGCIQLTTSYRVGARMETAWLWVSKCVTLFCLFPMSPCSMWPLHCIWDTTTVYRVSHKVLIFGDVHSVPWVSGGSFPNLIFWGPGCYQRPSVGCRPWVYLCNTQINYEKLPAAGWASAHSRILVLVRWDTLSSVCSTF